MVVLFKPKPLASPFGEGEGEGALCAIGLCCDWALGMGKEEQTLGCADVDEEERKGPVAEDPR